MSFVNDDNRAELACSYAALILQDSNPPINAENIATLLESAGVEVEGYYPKLFASVLEGRDIEGALFGGSGSGSDSSSGSDSDSDSDSDSSSDSD